jgi:hypothetical protein
MLVVVAQRRRVARGRGRNASEHLDPARRLQALPCAYALRSGVFNSLSLIERAFPLWCLGNSVFDLLARREVENENA